MPLNSNLAIAQAAARPKTRLSGTAIAATSSVSRIAASASGSPKRREIGAEPVAERLDEDDDQRQQQEEREEGDGDADQHDARAERLRWSTRRGGVTAGAEAMAASDMAEPPAAPGLEQVDDEQHARTRSTSMIVAIAVAPA